MEYDIYCICIYTLLWTKWPLYIPGTHPGWSTLPLWRGDLHLVLVLLLEKKKVIFALEQQHWSSSWTDHINMRSYSSQSWYGWQLFNEILWPKWFVMSLFFCFFLHTLVCIRIYTTFWWIQNNKNKSPSLQFNPEQRIQVIIFVFLCHSRSFAPIVSITDDDVALTKGNTDIWENSNVTVSLERKYPDKGWGLGRVSKIFQVKLKCNPCRAPVIISHKVLQRSCIHVG